MIKICYTNGIIEVYSKYNKKLVEIFRGLDNRRWNNIKKCWNVGLSDLTDLLIPELKREGFEYEFDESYINFFKEEKKRYDNFNLKLPLYDFQIDGANNLVNNYYYALFDDMGVGKTTQMIAALNKLKERGEAGRVLVICPNSLKKQWFDEIKKFSELGRMIIEGTKKKRNDLWEKRCRIKIINYELVRFDNYPFDHEWDVLILDESQRIKNPFAQTTRFVKKIRAKRRYVLTGTPIKNMVVDLYSIFEFLNPLILGSYRNFKEWFLKTELRYFGGNTFEEVVGYKNLDKLTEKIKPYYIRRTKEEVLTDLPDIVTQKIWIELNKRERGYYSLIKNIIVNKIEEIKKGKRESILGDIVLLRVLCNGEACLKISKTQNKEIQKEQEKMENSSSKNDECIRLINSLLKQNGDKIIVFSDFVSPLLDLEERLRKMEINFCSLHGGVKDREKQIEEFKFNNKKRILLAQTISGGLGLNLQVANHVIFLNGQWTNADREQALSRAHRSGQKKTVFVYDLIIRGSIEEKVLKVLEDKKQLSERIIAKNIKEFM